MDFIDKISEDIKTAMKAKDKVALESLRAIKKELLEARSAKGSSGEVSESDAIKIMQKMVKQRLDVAAIYIQQGRPELAEKEEAEAKIISRYLPEPMSAEELEKAVKEVIDEVGATSMKEMGKVMGIASKKLAGKADGKEISAVVRKLLS
ncbi:MAG: GatB/YqeY domain-containing protein [Chlorobi bacterium]|nr:GatB/YqeY domain-containing protein [Chlorobiota bacterium]